MGTLGKILLFVNLVAFIGLTYFATTNWGARQAASANALSHQLVLQGMPVEAPKGISGDADNIPLGTIISGIQPVETVRPSFLKKHFEGTGSSPYASGEFPKTQLEELDGSYRKMTANLDGMKPDEVIATLGGSFTPVPNNKLVRFTPGILTNIAETAAERALLRKLSDNVSDAKKRAANAETLRAIFNKKMESTKTINPAQADTEASTLKDRIEAVRVASDKLKRAFDAFKALPADAEIGTKTSAAQAVADAGDALGAEFTLYQNSVAEIGSVACRDESDRRRRIAHILMHLDESASWQKRVALTVGLRTYLSALSDHSNRIQRFTAAAEQQVILDQARFADEYELLKNLAISQALLNRQQIAFRSDLETQRSKDAESVKVWLAFAEARIKELDTINAQLEGMLTAQYAKQKELFDLQKQVGESLTKSFELEKQLETAEQGK
jgi:hypothetical protein